MELSKTMKVNTKEEGFQASSSLIPPNPMSEGLGFTFTDPPIDLLGSLYGHMLLGFTISET